LSVTEEVTISRWYSETSHLIFILVATKTRLALVALDDFVTNNEISFTETATDVISERKHNCHNSMTMLEF
jgi:hypothetical protein